MEKVEQSAVSYMESCMPELSIRKAVLSTLADALTKIHSLSPSCWGLNDSCSLNFQWQGGSPPVILMLENGKTGQVWFHFDKQDILSMPEEERKRLETEAKKLEVNDRDWCGASILLPEQEGLYQDIVKRMFYSYIDKKLSKPRRRVLNVGCQPTHTRAGAGYIRYMRSFLGRQDIPQPLWYEPSQTTNSNQGSDNRNGNNPMPVFDMIKKYLEERGYHFTPTQIASFYTALQTKGFVILSGISGTGKTKLAQEFARLLPQPVMSSVIPDDITRIKIQPYMRKYSRMIIPKSLVKLFDPPKPGKPATVDVEFDGQKESCLLSHYQGADSDYVHLLLRGNVRTWFIKNFPENSEIALELLETTEGNLRGFKLGRPDTFAQPGSGKKDGSQENHLFLSVRPDWRDSKSLLGYYNPLTKTYQWTPFVEFLIKAKESYAKKDGLAWFLILDEMNLARVEYYFADLLSVLESGRDAEGYTREALLFDCGEPEEAVEKPPEPIKLPPNFYIVGTVNVDETTQSFSPKVLDRAFSLEFVDVNLAEYELKKTPPPPMPDDSQRKILLTAFTNDPKFAQIDKTVISQFTDLDKFKQKLVALNASLQPSNHHFGYRVFDEIMMFLVNAKINRMFDNINGGLPEDTAMQAAFDQAILMKVLPKFHGSRGKLEKPLKAVLTWCAKVDSDPDLVKNTFADPDRDFKPDDWNYPATAHRVVRMLQSLNSTGFASFG